MWGLDAAGGGRKPMGTSLEQCNQIVSVTTLSRFTVAKQPRARQLVKLLSTSQV